MKVGVFSFFPFTLDFSLIFFLLLRFSFLVPDYGGRCLHEMEAELEAEQLEDYKMNALQFDDKGTKNKGTKRLKCCK